MLGANGMGLGAHTPGIDLLMGTFSKALGSFGAYVAGSRALIAFLQNACAGFIYTTALPPPLLGAIAAGLDLIPTMDAERAHLAAQSARLRQAFAALGIDTGASTTQIIPAMVGEAQAALDLAAALRARGVLDRRHPPRQPCHAGTSRLPYRPVCRPHRGRRGHPDRGRRVRLAPRPARRLMSQLRCRHPGVFVTGTGTGIGKTIVCAALVQSWRAAYWKPVQTGIAIDPADSETIAQLVPGAPIAPPRHILRAPLSPEAAAAAERTTISLADFDLPTADRPIVVEGAGGVLVPLNATELMIDLMVRLALPVILVATTSLGTINHTLLSLAALRARHLALAGVILVGEDDPGNASAIARHGHARILHRLARLTPLTPATLRAAAAAFPPYDAVVA